jgi:glyoxylase-like metal-dependent hydrolase (beta-lactamase superfamily II)
VVPYRHALIASLVAAGTLPSSGRAQVAPRQWPPTFQFVQVVPNVYAAIEPQNSTGLVHGNTVFVIDDDAVFVLDANHTPAAARATIAQLRAVTSKPVRTIMYSHWHNDHNLGAIAFAEAYPGPLRIISTDSTRDDILHKFVETAPARGVDYYATRSAVYD